MNAPDDTVESMAERVLQNENLVNQLEQQITTDKVFAAIRDHVTLDHKSISLEDFEQLFKADTPSDDKADEDVSD